MVPPAGLIFAQEWRYPTGSECAAIVWASPVVVLVGNVIV